MQKTQKHPARKLVAAAATATVAAAMIAAGAPSASAANQIVNTKGDTFTPSALTAVVNVGDTVTFNGLGGHNATSTAASVAKFASPAGAASFVYKTTTPGKHTYDCTFHSGMVGSFTVVGAAAAGAPAPAAPAPAAPAPAAPAPAAPAPAGDAPAAPAPAGDPAAAGGQVSEVPVGGAASGGGSTASSEGAGMATAGGGLLMAAFMTAFLGRRAARRN